jgi:4-hydroxybenzoate polyprenyltransferase
VAARGGAVDIFAAYVRLLRIPQWLKNGFIFAPLVFAGELRNPGGAVVALSAFVSFSLVASAVYILNDCLDREDDRHHPEKRSRPIASGLVSPVAALLLAGSLLVLGLGSAVVMTNAAVVGLESLYLLINAAYSLGLKRVVILDVFAVASGFVIRVLVGAVAVGVAASHWLLLCTLLLALFLGFSKRHGELTLLQQEGMNHRRVLDSYSPALIAQLNMVLCSATVVSYALYTVSPETIAKFGTDRLIYTVPFVLYGLFRYLFLVEIKGDGGNPSSLVLRDKSLAVCIALWLGACVAVIYLPAGGGLK